MRGGNQATLQELAERIDQADAVVIGGGSGLSSAAGYDHYHWSPALSEALAPFREQYGFTSPLAGFYHCFSSYGEQWGYYSQYIRFMWEAPTGQPYLDLQALVADKPAFVLTTNVDQQFFRVFPQKQICASTISAYIMDGTNLYFLYQFLFQRIFCNSIDTHSRMKYNNV